MFFPFDPDDTTVEEIYRYCFNHEDPQRDHFVPLLNTLIAIRNLPERVTHEQRS